MKLSASINSAGSFQQQQPNKDVGLTVIFVRRKRFAGENDDRRWRYLRAVLIEVSSVAEIIHSRINNGHSCNAGSYGGRDAGAPVVAVLVGCSCDSVGSCLGDADRASVNVVRRATIETETTSIDDDQTETGTSRTVDR